MKVNDIWGKDIADRINNLEQTDRVIVLSAVYEHSTIPFPLYLENKLSTYPAHLHTLILDALEEYIKRKFNLS